MLYRSNCDVASVIRTRDFLRCGYVSVPKVVAHKTPKKRKKRGEVDWNALSAGDFATDNELLDALHYVFRVLSKMRLPHKEFPELRRMGIFLVPSGSIYERMHDIPNIRVDRADTKSFGLPSFLSYTTARSDDKCMDVVWARKLKDMRQIEPTKSGVLYEICFKWGSYERDKIGKYINKHAEAVNFFVEVMPDGKVRQLRHYQRVLPPPPNGHKDALYLSKGWRYQPVLNIDSVNLDEDDNPWVVNTTVAARLAAATFNVAMLRETTINIVVRDENKNKLVFGVPMHKWKDFFTGRIDGTVNGRRKPIFHFCRPHKRKTSSGETIVRMHTRGSRHFEWNGLDVKIVLPGLHGKAAAEWNLSAESLEDDEPIGDGILIGSAMKTVEKIIGH